MNDSFRSFLNDVKERLFSEEDAVVLEPESPPNWTRLGWKTGWITEEAHTGLQWWLTEEHEWESLSAAFGQSRRQKNQSFSRWYSSLLDEYRRELGVPLKLDTVRWRQMDLEAFKGRPLIQEQDWWVVEIEGTRTGSWYVILSERFIAQFEEDVEDSPEPDPPWTFLELWDTIDSSQKQDVLNCIGTKTGLLNHLASLVLAGSLDLETLGTLMPRQPLEELRNLLENRRDQLSDLSAGQEDQTLKQWKKDAVKNLTDRVGQWLLDGELSSGEWDAYQEEWSDFRVEVLQETFDSGSWASLWKNLHERDLKRLVPRLNREKLSVSLVQAKTTVRDHFAAALPERQVHMIFDEPPASKKHLDVLKAREEIFSELRETIPSINHDLVGELKLGD